MLKFVRRLALGNKPHFCVARFGLAKGARIYIDPRHHLRRYLGLEESRLHPHVRKLLRRGMRTFDIGGEFGYYAIQFARLTGSAVVSFEPDFTAAEIISQGAILNRVDVTVVQSFVSCSVGERATTIDAASEAYFVPDLIKIDVEGAEFDVLQGGVLTIEMHRPAFVIEVHSIAIEQKCLTFLNKYGYNCRVIDPNPFWDANYRKLPHNRWVVAQ